MMKRKKSFWVVAGCVLAAGSLYATDYNETFESANSWSEGTLVATNYTYNGVAGKPLAEVNPNHVLVIEGDSSYDASTGEFTGSPMVDMMVQAALPDDGLEAPEEGAHIAVAVDTNGFFNVYCKNKSDVAGWYPLSSKVYADGAWARVSLLFDYANGLCQIRIDGEPMMTENGYLNTDTEKTGNGAWYKLLTTTGSAVSNLKVVGCTAIDDVVIAANADNYVVAANATNDVGVSCAWLDKYGLAWDATTAGSSYDSTGMTVAEKYDACLSPFDGQTFEVKSVEVKDGVTKVGIPATVDTVGRKVVLQSSEDSSFPNTDATTTTDVDPGQTEVEVALPAAGSVKYFRLRAMDK